MGRGHYLERIEGGGYDREEYEQYPDRYNSTFNKKVGLIVSLIIQLRIRYNYTRTFLIHLWRANILCQE